MAGWTTDEKVVYWAVHWVGPKVASMAERSVGESVGSLVAAMAVALVVRTAVDLAAVKVGQWVEWMGRQVADAMVAL